MQWKGEGEGEHVSVRLPRCKIIAEKLKVLEKLFICQNLDEATYHDHRKNDRLN